MGSVYDFPDRRVVEEEAAKWLIRLDSDEPLSLVDVEALREWLEQSQVHREELSSLISFYGKMDILTDLAGSLGSTETGLRRKLTFSPVATAAAFFMVIVGGLIAASLSFNQDFFIRSNGVYATPVGVQETATLSDGSTIQLNTNTRLEVEYTDSYRDVRLHRGEAYFDVAKRRARPFRVYAGGGRVEAIGTAFVVRFQDDDVNVTVAEGKVSVAAFKQRRPTTDETSMPEIDNEESISGDVEAKTLGTLSAGQSTWLQGSVNKNYATNDDPGARIFTVDPQEIARRLSWRNGLLMFKGESLEQVVEEISRYTAITIEIDDPQIRNVSIGGQFRIGDTEGLLDALEANFDLRVTRLDQNHVQLSSTFAPPDSALP